MICFFFKKNVNNETVRIGSENFNHVGLLSIVLPPILLHLLKGFFIGSLNLSGFPNISAIKYDWLKQKNTKLYQSGNEEVAR